MAGRARPAAVAGIRRCAGQDKQRAYRESTDKRGHGRNEATTGCIQHDGRSARNQDKGVPEGQSHYCTTV
jgi:hypothetical protein